jgi:hypothetical protein
MGLLAMNEGYGQLGRKGGEIVHYLVPLELRNLRGELHG